MGARSGLLKCVESCVFSVVDGEVRERKMACAVGDEGGGKGKKTAQTSQLRHGDLDPSRVTPQWRRLAGCGGGSGGASATSASQAEGPHGALYAPPRGAPRRLRLALRRTVRGAQACTVARRSRAPSPPRGVKGAPPDTLEAVVGPSQAGANAISWRPAGLRAPCDGAACSIRSLHESTDNLAVDVRRWPRSRPCRWSVSPSFVQCSLGHCFCRACLALSSLPCRREQQLSSGGATVTTYHCAVQHDPR